jgi:multidrug efflux pump subunit AcrA (membrane-fusion protein)
MRPALASFAIAVIFGAVPNTAFAQAGAGPLERAINCSIRASRTIELSPAFDGIVAEVFVRPGQRVEAGAPLLRLNTDLDEAELSFRQARAGARGSLNAARQRRDGLEARVERLRGAYERQAVSFGELESAELELRSAEAEVARREEELRLAAQEAAPLRRKIELATILSPADGVIGEDVLDPGEATQGRALLTVYVLSPLRVEAFVPRSALPQVAAAQALAFTVDGVPVPPEAVRFDYVSPIADLASGTNSVFFHLESDQIMPGSVCEARL